MEMMHFTGPVWRPPYEANSLLLQATVGCTHDSCRFCTLYPDIRFRLAPFSEIEEDLKIASRYQPDARRVFLTGANPFVMSFNKLEKIALLIRKYLPGVRNIGGFARVTDFKNKTPEELRGLQRLGYDRISIGTETGDDITLARMNKGNTAKDTLEQCRKLDEAGIEYNFIYLTGLAGKGNGQRNALASARLFNQLNPFIINVVSLTVFPESELFRDILEGRYVESAEWERLDELITLFTHLRPVNGTTVLANTVSNPVPLTGQLPRDRELLIHELQMIRDQIPETELRSYRENIRSL